MQMKGHTKPFFLYFLFGAALVGAFLLGHFLKPTPSLQADIFSSLSSASSTTSATSSAAVSQNTTTTFEYKLYQNFDLCTLNKLGGQGWHVLQIGSVITLPNFDTDCKSLNSNSIDWVILERQKS